MSEKKNNSTKPTPSRNLGRQTAEEYAAMQNSDRIYRGNKKRFHPKNLGRMTDEEYENLQNNKYLYIDIYERENNDE